MFCLIADTITIHQVGWGREVENVSWVATNSADAVIQIVVCSCRMCDFFIENWLANNDSKVVTHLPCAWTEIKLCKD